jgi:PPOX class probable F420-dependent enzyme
VSLSEHDVEFLEKHHSAAMVTVGSDGFAKVARVGVALVDGNLWSSGTQDRVRTRRLRRNPRCTLYVHDPSFAWLAIEARAAILDGPDAARHNLRLFRAMQARPMGPLSWFGGELEEDAFLRAMGEERRLIYEFEVERTYGLH